jgi:hypothetical protein
VGPDPPGSEVDVDEEPDAAGTEVRVDEIGSGPAACPGVEVEVDGADCWGMLPAVVAVLLPLLPLLVPLFALLFLGEL